MEPASVRQSQRREGNKMERKRSVRRRPKPPFERAKDHCRAFLAFTFSNVGITFLVVLYMIAGEFNLSTHRTFHLTLNGETNKKNTTFTAFAPAPNKLLMDHFYHLFFYRTVVSTVFSSHYWPCMCTRRKKGSFMFM